MKHKYLLLSMLIMGSGYSVAQSQYKDAPVIVHEKMDEQYAQQDVAARYASDAPIVNTPTTADTLFYSDFSNTGDWSFQNQGGYGWAIVQSGAETGWFLSSLQSTSGGAVAEMNNGDPNAGQEGPREQIMQTANPIDVSSVTGGAIVMWQQRTWRFLDQYHIEVSNNGTNWVEIGDLDHILTSTAFNSTVGSASNPEYVAYYVPASVSGAGNNNLWVRFRWNDQDDDGVAYGWLIDDVVVYRGSANDLDLQRTYYLGATDSAAYLKYSRIPARQGDNSNFVPAGAIVSQGDVTQSNVVMTVTESNTGYSASTSAATLNNGDLIIDEVSGGPFQTNGTGNYSLVYSVTNGQPEYISINDQETWNFSVTDNTWSYDDGEAQAASWYGDAGYTMCIYYDNFAADTIRSIDVYFPEFSGTTGDFGLQGGEVVGAFIYNGGLDTILGENGFYTVPGTAGQFVNDWVTIPVNAPIEGSRDGYFACFRVYNDEIPFGIEWDNPSGLSLVDPDNAGTWFNPITTTADTHNTYPMVRVNTTDPNACLGVNITISGIVADILAAEPFEASIDLTVSGNGATPLSYAWTGPGGFSSDQEDITGLDTKGTYTVVVTDVNGCSNSTSFDVAGNVGVDELGDASFNVFPNPANDQLTVAFDITGNFNVDLMNIKGELVSSRQVNVNAGNNINFKVDELPAGVYIVKVYNDSQKVTKEVLIK